MSDPKNIKYFREFVGLSQAELAEKCNLSQNHISQIELGKKKPSLESLRKIAEVLNVSESELLNGPQKNEIEIRVIVEETNDWNTEVMDLTSQGKDRFSVHIGPEKIGVEITGKFDGPADLDDVFARARKCAEETLIAQGRLAGI